MTNMNDITIFDEIVNCGILEEDSVLNFGAGYCDGKFLETLAEYNGNLGEKLVSAIDVDPKKIRMLSKKFKNEDIFIKEISMQDFLDDSPIISHWIVMTGIFDKFLYGDQQNNFVITSVESALQYCDKGLIFTLKEDLTEDFRYAMSYLFIKFTNTYEKVTVKKFSDGNHIFCIFK